MGLFGFLNRKESPAAPAALRIAAPIAAEAPGVEPFLFAEHLDHQEGFPYLRWPDAHAWIERVAPEARAAAWDACESGWLLHLRDALGPAFEVTRGTKAAVLSSLPAAGAAEAVAAMEKLGGRILKVLQGVAQPAEWGVDVLVMFDDGDSYYRYVSRYYPEQGEFAVSSGMHINDGASYYVTTRDDASTIYPVIAHEMTHGFVGHLPLPLWLNEGLAVNTEHRLAPRGAPLHTPQEMREKHRRFWGEAEVQEFWSGASFQRADEGNELSYDLARILVDQMSADWERFAAFACAANWSDGGAQAAREQFGMNLGDAAGALLELEGLALEPDPSRWPESRYRAPA